MLVLAKRNIIIPCAEGNVPLRMGMVENIPDKLMESKYVKDLIQDGKIVVPPSAKDKDMQEADEKPVKVRRGKKQSEE